MENAERDRAIKEIRTLIEGREKIIIPTAERTIHDHIASKPLKDCLTIITRNSTGKITEAFIPAPPDARYVKVLIAFVRKRDFENKTLDSGLSDGTAEAVAKVFADDLEKVADTMAEKLVSFLFNSQVFLDGVATAITSAYKGTIPVHLQSKVTSMLVSKLKTTLMQHVDTTSITAIKASIGKIVGASVSSPLAAKIITMMVHTLTTTMKPILVKIMASTALKTAIVAKVKTVIVASFLGAFIKIIAVKLGLSAGAAFVWILLPILVAWLGFEAAHFPDKLAKNVSTDVAQDLRNGFSKTSESIAVTIVEMAITQASAILARDLVHEDDVAQMIHEFVSEASA